jgi:hypothetical protein
MELVSKTQRPTSQYRSPPFSELGDDRQEQQEQQQNNNNKQTNTGLKNCVLEKDVKVRHRKTTI